MEFSFLGTGDMYNLEDGNTSAYFYNNDKSILYLIDCGFDVYPKIIKNKLLDGIKVINIFITHLSPDHSGSLCALLLHMGTIRDKMIIPVHLFYGENEMISEFLVSQGFNSETYPNINLVNVRHNESKKVPYDIEFNEYLQFTFMESYTTTSNIKTYAILFEFKNDKNILYVGGAKANDLIRKYIDTCIIYAECSIDTDKRGRDIDSGLSIDELKDIVAVKKPYAFKLNIMHYDESLTDKIISKITGIFRSYKVKSSI